MHVSGWAKGPEDFSTLHILEQVATVLGESYTGIRALAWEVRIGLLIWSGDSWQMVSSQHLTPCVGYRGHLE